MGERVTYKGMNDLRQAFSRALGTPAVEAPAPPPPKDALPDPLQHPWGQQLRSLGAALPKQPTLGQLRQRSDALVRELKAGGRGRDSAALQQLREDYEKLRTRTAWGLIKERFEELALSERAYRALKQQEGLEPAEVLARLRKHGENLKGAGADKVRDTLLGKSVL